MPLKLTAVINQTRYEKGRSDCLQSQPEKKFYSGEQIKKCATQNKPIVWTRVDLSSNYLSSWNYVVAPFGFLFDHGIKND